MNVRIEEARLVHMAASGEGRNDGTQPVNVVDEDVGGVIATPSMMEARTE
jgi:hypothetical protein